MAMREDMLRGIRKGMRVLSSDGVEVGTVEFVHSAEGAGPGGTAAASLPDQPDRTGLLETIAEAFRPDTVPEELRERLLMHGFIRIDSAGLFAADRFVMLKDVASVKDEAVRLRLNRDELKGRKL